MFFGKVKFNCGKIFERLDISLHVDFVLLFCCFTSRATAMVQAERPVHLTTLFPMQA